MSTAMFGSTTEVSLLANLRKGGDSASWGTFGKRYGELVMQYCRGCGLQQADAEDIRQIVMVSLMQSLARFEYRPERGRFRDYLRRATRHAIARWARRPTNAPRALSVDVAVECTVADACDRRWDLEWVRFHYRLAMETVRLTHERESLEMFDRLLGGAPVSQVAAEFGTSVDAVHKVKQRIRRRLQELIVRQIAQEEQFGA